MNFAKIPNGAIEHDDEFESRAAVEASLKVAPNSRTIWVFEGTSFVPYRRITGATDLIGGDFSTWQKAGISPADLASFAGDLVTLNTAVINTKGIWTPALSWSGGGGSFTYATQQGRFDRVADLVSLRANIVFMVNAGGIGNLQLTGLPFPVRAGAFADSIDVTVDSFYMQTPVGGGRAKVRIAGGFSNGPFTYDAGANSSSIFVTGLSAPPVGNGSLVTLGGTGRTAQITNFTPHPSIANAGWVFLNRRFAEITEGMTLTGTTWAGSATLAGSWFGAPAQTSYWDRSLVQNGEYISIELAGEISI